MGGVYYVYECECGRLDSTGRALVGGVTFTDLSLQQDDKALGRGHLLWEKHGWKGR